MGGPKPDFVEEMFDSIAPEYDALNHILSLDADKGWRRRSIRRIIDRNFRQNVLDIACGTGDFSIQIASSSHPQTTVIGFDLSQGMLDVMTQKVRAANLSERITTLHGNCESLPFDNDSFDVVTIAFGIRNVERREVALREMLRVLKPGGTVLILELSVPSSTIIRKLYEIYFLHILPYIGGKVSGKKSAYEYLPASVLKFPGRDEWMVTMRQCGFADVRHKAYTFGICRQYIGRKIQ